MNVLLLHLDRKLGATRSMPHGRCSGCGDIGPLPPFGGGMCFLCATDGPPGQHTPSGGALQEDADARRWDAWPSDDEIELRDEVRALFDDAQLLGVSAGLGGDFRDRFCFSTSPNAPTRARWLTRHRRPEPRERKPKPAPKPKRERAPTPPVQGRRGRKVDPNSRLARTVAWVMAHPGCTIAEIAQGVGESQRAVTRSAAESNASQRLLRCGSHGHARFYAGPRAGAAKPVADALAEHQVKLSRVPAESALPERQAKLSCVLAESALAALERRAKDAGLSLGAAIEALLAEVEGTFDRRAG